MELSKTLPETVTPGILKAAKILFALLVTVFLSIFTILLALPIAYFLMLLAGNLGLSASFWDVLPGGIALSLLKAGSLTVGALKNMTTKEGS